MIFCFTEMGDLIKNRHLVEGKTKEESEAYRELMKDEGFALFSKYFWCLWW
jgi:hypothetical protein